MINHCSITPTEIEPGIYTIEVQCQIAEGLSANQFNPFNPKLEFAGVSLRGKLLSTDKAGPAQINGFKVAEEPPKNWVDIHGHKGVLVSNPKPELIIVPTRGNPGLYIQTKDLLPRVQVGWDYSQYTYETKLNTALYFYRKYPTCKIKQNGDDLHVVVPQNLALPSEDWKLLEQHNYSGALTATCKKVVPMETNGNYFSVAVSSVPDLTALYGLTGTPESFEGGKLSFHEVRVTDGQKAKLLHPLLEFVANYTIDYSPVRSVTAESLLENPRLLEDNRPLELHANKDMAQVSTEGLTIDIKLLDRPLIVQDRTKDETLVYLQKAWVDQYFVSVRSAAKGYYVGRIKKYRLIVDATNQPISGLYVARKSLIPAAVRNPKEEAAALKEREYRLTSLHGPLPTNWEKHKDEEIAQYFELQKRQQNGELLPVESSPVLPPEDDNAHAAFVTWLEEQKCITICPLTGVNYIKAFDSIEELADIPNFIDMLSSAYGDRKYLSRLLLSNKVRSLLTADLL